MLIDSDYLQDRKNKATLVKNILDEVILDACCRENCFLITNFINIFSFDLIADGAHPKPYYITQKTEKNGMLAGFILEQSNSSEKSKTHGFEYRDITTPYNMVGESLVEPKALHNKDNLVTSDLDIVLIARMSFCKNSDIYFEHDMGYICQDDMQTFNFINKEFKQKLLAENNQKIQHNIIQHGALNCCPTVKLADLNFPMCVYSPQKNKHYIGEKETFKQNMLSFLNLCHSIRELGYILRMHENWI